MRRRLFIRQTTSLAAAGALLPAVAFAAAAGSKSTFDSAPQPHQEKEQMESEIDKTVVRRFNKEVIEQGHRGAFEELMDPAFINRSAPADAPNGPESMWNTFEHVLRPALSNLRVEIYDQLCDGDKVTTRKSITGTHTGTFLGIAPTGKAVSIDVIDIVRVRGGRYVEHWGINTLPSVLAQLRVQKS